jgi:uncharacterized protein (TIGR02266 family)
VEAELRVQIEDVRRPGSSFADVLRNASEGGVFVATSVTLPIGTPVLLRVDPGIRRRPIELRARVVRVHEDPGETGSLATDRDRGMALAFEESDDEALERYLGWVRAMAKGEAGGG